jgi:hypothetical protein
MCCRESTTVKEKGTERVDEQMQRWLLTVLAVVVGTLLARSINNFIDEQIS